MYWLFKQLLWAALAGALLAAIAGAGYHGYMILDAGFRLDSVPPLRMVMEVMQLHHLAAYGAVTGIGLALLGRVWRVIKRLILARFNSAPVAAQQADPDSMIRAERSQLADSYLSTLGERTLDHVLVTPHGDEERPDIENIITARGGTFTYRVLAFRHLSEKERMAVVQEALRLGHVQEPEPGGISTVMTSIGK